MRLICPNCEAQYEVPDNAISMEGRDVQCSSCGHTWFQLHPDQEAAIAASREAIGAENGWDMSGPPARPATSRPKPKRMIAVQEPEPEPEEAEEETAEDEHEPMEYTPAPQPATVLKAAGPLAETGADFALLRIADDSLPAFALHRPQDSLKLSQVIAAGFPGDVLEMDGDFAALRGGDLAAMPGLTVTDGIVNTEQAFGPTTRVLMHSAPLSTGNSGGPLIDMCGRVVGVNSFVRKGRLQNRGYALAVSDLIAFLDGTPAAPQIDETACAPVVLKPQPAGAEPQPPADGTGGD